MPNTPVLEREAELAALSRARKRAGDGRGGWITVTGPAGIGKTRLLERVATEAAAAGWFVLNVRTPGSRPDHCILLEMLAGLAPGATPLDGPARALTSFRDGGTPPTRALTLGLRWLLEDLASHRPTLVVVDDLQAGDVLSLRVLREVRDHLRELPCLVVAAATDEPPRTTRATGTPALVQELVAQLVGQAWRVTPSPLSRAAVRALVRADRPGAGDDETDLLHDRSAGNPGALRDLLAGPATRAVLPDTQARLVDGGREALLVGDAHRAATLLGRAVEGTPGDATLLGNLARALCASGDVDGAVARWQQARDLSTAPAAVLEHAAAAAEALADAGRLTEAMTVYADLAAQAPAELRRWVHDRHLLLARVCGVEPPAYPAPVAAGADPVSRLATAVALANGSHSARRVRRLALGAARDAASGRLPARSLFLATTLLCAASAFDEADEILTVIHDNPVDHQALMVAVACRGHVRVRAGRVDQGLADLERAGGRVLDGGATRDAADLAAVIDGRLARGEVAEAVRLADLLAGTPLTAGLGAALARSARGEVASATGNNTRALELFQEAGRCLGPDLDNPALLPWRVGAAFAETRSGNPARALTLARDNLRLASQFGAPYAEAQALRTIAAVDVTADRLGLLREAVDLARSVSAVRLQAQISTDLAALLMLTEGGDAEALTLLHEVHEYATAQELRPLGARARRLLVRLDGVPTRRPAEALSDLTAAERRTARLAAAGSTNKQIAEATRVSVKSVEWHLSGCYRKLGIRSRRQLLPILGAV